MHDIRNWDDDCDCDVGSLNVLCAYTVLLRLTVFLLLPVPEDSRQLLNYPEYCHLPAQISILSIIWS